MNVPVPGGLGALIALVVLVVAVVLLVMDAMTLLYAGLLIAALAVARLT
jgi:hypothetical protein